MATATKPRSPFQAPADSPTGSDALYVLHQSTRSDYQGEQKTNYLSHAYAVYMNAERTIAVISNYSTYDVIVRTTLAVEDVFSDEADDKGREGEYWDNLRANGIWYPLVRGLTSKTKARAAAEHLLKGVQDVTDPLRVEIDGQHGPAFTIAMAGFDGEREYRRDDERSRRLHPLAEVIGVDPRLLALAVAEDRLIWATPPVAPKQVMVVVKEDATANLTERLVDEVVLASGVVEGLGRIVEEGSVSTYLLRMRTFEQKQAIRDVVTTREALQEALQAVQQRSERLLAEVAGGTVVGRGFHDTLRIADDTEKAQKAATAYACATEDASSLLPASFLTRLLKGEFINGDSGRIWTQEVIRVAIKALAEVNGMEVDRRYDY